MEKKMHVGFTIYFKKKQLAFLNGYYIANYLASKSLKQRCVIGSSSAHVGGESFLLPCQIPAQLT